MKLTELQLNYLSTMYRMGLFPDAKPIQAGKIIGEVVCYFGNTYTDSLGEMIDQFYALAQPWRIEEPLIICFGNIGSDDYNDCDWFGAASPAFTEAKLTEAGIKYINDLNLNH